MPRSQKDFAISRISNSIKLAVSFGCLLSSVPIKAETAESSIYTDSQNGFSMKTFPGWITNFGKVPRTTMAKFAPEETLFVGSNFAEGSSLSVTKSNAPRLLKDFDIEWWFAPLNDFKDLGSAQLIADLLILQRQGEFEKKTTTSEIVEAKIDDGVLYFRFRTPLARQVDRETIAKAYLKNNSIYTLWISGLTSVFEGEYASKLTTIRDSFVITN